MIYDGVITKPKLDDALAHYGVPGMRWGHRKQKTYANGMTYRQMKKSTKRDKKILKKEAKMLGVRNKRKYVKNQLIQKYGETSMKDFNREKTSKTVSNICLGLAAANFAYTLAELADVVAYSKNGGRIRKEKTRPVKEKFRIEDQRTVDRTPKDFIDAKYDKKRGVYR